VPIVTGVKAFVQLVVLTVVTLFAVILFNAYRHSPAPRADHLPENRGRRRTAIAEHLSQAIKFRTISHQNRDEATERCSPRFGRSSKPPTRRSMRPSGASWSTATAFFSVAGH